VFFLVGVKSKRSKISKSYESSNYKETARINSKLKFQNKKFFHFLYFFDAIKSEKLNKNNTTISNAINQTTIESS
jgi:hypothetical protein